VLNRCFFLAIMVEINLALYGKATHSDLVENPWSADGHASNAIDGNHDSHYDHGSCTATTMQNDPWWRLDLLDKYIHIGNSLLNNGNSNPLAGKISSIPGGRSLTFKWKKGIPGRYINVVIPGSNRLLTLCEVEVYGYPAPDGENMNIYDVDLNSMTLIKVINQKRDKNSKTAEIQ
uniref:Si:ch211-215k15.4 n=1 Tax=Sinocyclocheilus anshuiensis TaxID=1608454 RepID=A0A671M233_9TELE